MSLSLNLELSLIVFLRNKLAGKGTIVTRRYPQERELPAILIETGDTDYNLIEIGSKLFVRDVQVFIEIFARTDGERLELKDILVEALRKDEIGLYEAELDDSDNIILNGLICYLTLKDMSDNRVNLGINFSELPLTDRYRQLFTLVLTIGKAE